MMEFHLADPDFLPAALSAGAWLAVGTTIGALYFLTLRWNVRLFVAGRSPPLALVTQLVRFIVVAGGLAVISRQFGALPLLLTAAGIVFTRNAVVRLGAPP